MTRWLSKFLLLAVLPIGASAQTGLTLAGCVLETGDLFAIDATGNGKKGIADRGLHARINMFRSLVCYNGRSNNRFGQMR